MKAKINMFNQHYFNNYQLILYVLSFFLFKLYVLNKNILIKRDISEFHSIILIGLYNWFYKT